MAATLIVKIGATIDDFTKKMKSVEQQLDKTGDKLQSAGLKLAVGFARPLVAAGGAAVKCSAALEREMTQVVTLAGASSDELDGLRKSVLQLGGDTGKAPAELAQGLFFIESHGFKG